MTNVHWHNSKKPFLPPQAKLTICKSTKKMSKKQQKAARSLKIHKTVTNSTNVIFYPH